MRSETRGCRVPRNARTKRGRGVTAMRGRLSDGFSGTSSPLLRPPRTSACAMTATVRAMGMYLATASQRSATSSMSSGASPRCWFGSRPRASLASASSHRAALSRLKATLISYTALVSRRAVRIGRRITHSGASVTARIVEWIRLAAESKACCARRYGRTHSGRRVIPRRRLGQFPPPEAPRGARAESGLFIVRPRCA